MSKLVWSIALAIYVATMVTYNRFENSEHALLILGNIPSFISAIFTSFAFVVAALTFYSSKKREPSKESYTTYKESMNDLIKILKSKDYDNEYKTYYISLAYDALSKIEKYITEDDHKKAISVFHVMLKHEIKLVLHSIKIHDYFCSKHEFKGDYFLNVTSSADALYSYWYEHISGKSDFFKKVDGKTDFFAAYPHGIGEEFLINALAMYANNNLNLANVKKNIEKSLNEVETKGNNELIILSEKLPETVAYLLLKRQTTPSGRNGDKISLKLKSSFSDTFWLSYQMTPGGWLRHELPSAIKL